MSCSLSQSILCLTSALIEKLFWCVRQGIWTAFLPVFTPFTSLTHLSRCISAFLGRQIDVTVYVVPHYSNIRTNCCYGGVTAENTVLIWVKTGLMNPSLTECGEQGLGSGGVTLRVLVQTDEKPSEKSELTLKHGHQEQVMALFKINK